MAIDFLKANASDQGPKIRGRDYDRLQVGASDDRRDREFLEQCGYVRGMQASKPFTAPNVTIGDAISSEQQQQMSAATNPDKDSDTSFEM